jgi:polar amino acid transport system substrate-binding protein
MQKRMVCFLVVVLSIALTVVNTSAGPVMDRILSKKVLVVGTSGQQPPMSATAKNGELIGMDIDLANAMAEGLGVPVEYVRMPFADLLPALEAGKVDMILSGMTITAARNRKVAFVGPYYVSGKGILALGERYAELQDADGLNSPEVTVTTLKDSTSQIFAENLMPEAKLLPAASYDEAVEMVLEKKADVMVADLPFCVYAAYRYQDKGLSAGKSPLTFEPLGIAMAEDPLLINWVRNFLNTLQGTGQLKKLHAKWLESGSWISELP